MCESYNFSKKKQENEESKKLHDQEHITWNRRSFIQALGLVGGGSMMLGPTAISASKPAPLSVALSESENDNVLVIVRLKGGNDGLNTIVPVYDYDRYANLRPTIRHQQNNIIHLNDDFAIPNYMGSLESMWGDGNMKVVHGVGYSQQNLSHFSSSNIWASASNSPEEPTGWWGRYFEDLYPDYITNPPDVPVAVQIGSLGNLVFQGVETNYAFTVANIDQLSSVVNNGSFHDVTDIPDCVYGDKLLFLRSTTNTTFTYSQVINDAYLASNNNANYSTETLAKQLAVVARLIKGGLGSKVYMVTLGGFDTHANQVTAHQQALSDLADTMKNFYDDLGSTGMQNEVLTMTISEFGRRPYENGSNGTDHGAASPVMLFGAGLNGSGFVGEHPDLNNWDTNDNLIPTTDFRDIYATVLTDWFCLDPGVVHTILLNQTYDNLPLGFSCEALDTTDFANTTRFNHVATYNNSTTYIEFSMPATAHITIKLYDILGKEIGVIVNNMLFAGKHKVDIKAAINSRLSYGQYIYRITLGGQFYSRSVLIK